MINSIRTLISHPPFLGVVVAFIELSFNFYFGVLRLLLLIKHWSTVLQLSEPEKMA